MNKHTPSAKRRPHQVEDENISGSQEATPIPWFVGERKIAARWISRPYKIFAYRAPTARPTGKK